MIENAFCLSICFSKSKLENVEIIVLACCALHEKREATENIMTKKTGILGDKF